MRSATTASSSKSADGLHRQLAAFNRWRLAPSVDVRDWQDSLRKECDLRVVEGHFIESERAKVRDSARAVPTQPEQFVSWFESLLRFGPGQGDRLFPWLAESASLCDLTWFLSQEVAGEAGFEDLVALTQVKLPARAKLEMARNYWDEMGQGHEGGMHGPLLDGLSAALNIDCTQPPVWESLALGNLMAGLATNRRYTYQSVGALGAIELTAPGRAALVNAGLKRLGVGGAARRYFALHATLDVRHSAAWNREVLLPLVAQDSRNAVAIAEGALMRLSAGASCFQRYRSELGFEGVERAAS